MNSKYAIQLILASAMLVSACGGKKSSSGSSKVTTPPPTTTLPPTSTTPDELNAYASNSELGYNETTSIYASGGSGSYSYSMQSGTGRISSTGYYTAPNTTSTEVVLVRDTNTQESVTVTINVSNISNNTGCTQLGSASIAVNQTVEKSIDLTKHSTLAGYIIVGLGLRILDKNVVGIYSRLAKLKGDGTIDMNDTYNYSTGDLGGTSRGELYLQLPANYYAYGAGIAVESTGQDLDLIKIYGARLDGANGTNSGTIACYLRRNGTSGCSSNLSISHPSSYKEYLGSESYPLVGIGFGVNNNSVVNAVFAKRRSLEYRQSGDCSN